MQAKAGFLGGSLLSLCMLVFCLMQATGRADVIERALGLRVATSASIAHARTEQAVKPLEFLVWPSERQKALRVAKLEVESLINDRPHDVQLWRALVFLNLQGSDVPEHNFWLVENAVQLAAWNPKALNWLATPCVVHYEQFAKLDASLCQKILNRLPTKFLLEDLASIIEVDPKRLAKALSQEGISLRQSKP